MQRNATHQLQNFVTTQSLPIFQIPLPACHLGVIHHLFLIQPSNSAAYRLICNLILIQQSCKTSLYLVELKYYTIVRIILVIIDF